MRRWFDVPTVIELLNDIKEIPKNIIAARQNVPFVKSIPQPGEHRCYIQPVKKRDEEESDSTEDLSEQAAREDDVTEAGYNQLLFFDFECRQEKRNHEPNLCIIQNEAGDEWVFQGDNTRNEFCE